MKHVLNTVYNKQACLYIDKYGLESSTGHRETFEPKQNTTVFIYTFIYIVSIHIDRPAIYNIFSPKTFNTYTFNKMYRERNTPSKILHQTMKHFYQKTLI